MLELSHVYKVFNPNTVNEKIALETYVLLTGFGEAMILRAPLLIEYGRRAGEKKRDS